MWPTLLSPFAFASPPPRARSMFASKSVTFHRKAKPTKSSTSTPAPAAASASVPSRLAADLAWVAEMQRLMDQITPGDLCSAEVEVEDVPGDDPADDTEDGTYGLTRKRSYSSSSSVSDATDESEDEEQIGYRIPGEWPAT